jgi:hypothetical protein
MNDQAYRGAGGASTVAMRTEIEAGLVFAIPLANGAFGFGHLVARQRPIFYMMAYDVQSATHNIDDDALQRVRPILMGNFFNVLIRNRRWPPVRHLTPPVVPYPCFKIKIGDAFYVESWDRHLQREATEVELAQLGYRRNCGPIILENALNAHFGLGPCETTFEPLTAEAVSAVSEVRNFGSISH